MTDCAVCRREAGDAEPPGGWVWREEHWSVCVADGFEVPGWLFVELRGRHAEGPWSLTDDEAGALGPLLARVSGAVREAAGAERVYWMAFGELFPHFHVLLAPRYDGTPPELRGAALMGGRQQLLDPPESAEVAARVRGLLA